MVLVTHHCEEIPPGFTHAGLVRPGPLMAAGPLERVITSELVSACFDVPSRSVQRRAVVESRRLGVTAPP